MSNRTKKSHKIPYKKIIKVLCGGCFNRLHEGHVYFLKKCKALGNSLIVVVSNDNINNKKYGSKAVSAKLRKVNIESLGIADKVIIGRKTDCLVIVKKERPDIIALGYDQTMEELKGIKIKIVRIDKR